MKTKEKRTKTTAKTQQNHKQKQTSQKKTLQNMTRQKWCKYSSKTDQTDYLLIYRLIDL